MVLCIQQGQATTGVVAFARPRAAGAAMAYTHLPTPAFVVKATDPSPVLGDQLSSPPV